ncbi:VOC family protein [Streptomyces beihaiensis]|uniref:VOC family protein n=1 Tax=Streptomyces beihaiensis TaxID=2984495 RepID=A0ABT3TNG4_9ACTN|nr:VOC family protein [Streptomyces beihaiensis]MCX3058595.1 VOC family protein [Streptomyces beihaiensis]
MITTEFVPGAPDWIDLTTFDVEAATRFYGGVFGWKFASAGPEAGGYGMFRRGGRTVAGAMAVPAGQAPPAWNLYFHTTDADATAEVVEQAGGKVCHPPQDVFEEGRVAVCADPSGAAFGLWQPKNTKGFEYATGDGGLNWAQLHTADVDAAKRFYTDVFGWGTFDIEFPGGLYTSVNPAGAGPDSMFGGIVPLESDPAEASAGSHWTLYFHVSDVDAAADRARELGGTVRTEPFNLAKVGRIAKLADPSGARFAVIKGDPEQE